MRTAAAALGLLAACGASPSTDEAALERYYQGNRRFAEGQYSLAVPHYEHAIAVRDRLKDAYHKLAYCYERLGRESEAVSVLERLLEVDRQDEYALRNLGRLYVHRGLVDEALGAYRALEGRYPSVKAEIERLEKVKSARGD